MSSRNLKWAIYTLYVLSLVTVIEATVGIYMIANAEPFRSWRTTRPVGISMLALASLFCIWIIVTAKRLKAFKQTAWKHAFIISILSLFDLYTLPLASFIIYCLMDQNVRFLFKKETIRIGQ